MKFLNKQLGRTERTQQTGWTIVCILTLLASCSKEEIDNIFNSDNAVDTIDTILLVSWKHFMTRKHIILSVVEGMDLHTFLRTHKNMPSVNMRIE